MNKMVNIFRALVDAEDILKTHSSLGTSIEIFISKEDNKNFFADDLNLDDIEDYNKVVNGYIKTFECIPVRVDENLQPNEFKIKVNWED